MVSHKEITHFKIEKLVFQFIYWQSWTKKEVLTEKEVLTKGRCALRAVWGAAWGRLVPVESEMGLASGSSFIWGIWGFLFLFSFSSMSQFQFQKQVRILSVVPLNDVHLFPQLPSPVSELPGSLQVSHLPGKSCFTPWEGEAFEKIRIESSSLQCQKQLASESPRSQLV